MKITDYDALTGEAIVRDMDADELSQVEKLREEVENNKIALENKAATRAALLERLGLTEDEAKILLN